ncbi:Uncharacterized protein QTN25_005855 [Entamoeba marina]
MLVFVLFSCVFAADPIVIFENSSFTEGWSLYNTAGLEITVEKNSSGISYLTSDLRPWDTIIVQKTSQVDTSEYSFFSFIVNYEDEEVAKMLFRTRLFSSEYNQQTETELKPYDCRVKSGIETRVYVPLYIEEEDDTLQTFSIQRIETTVGKTQIKILQIELVSEGIPTPLNDVEDAEESESQDASVGIVVVLLLFTLMMFV